MREISDAMIELAAASFQCGLSPEAGGSLAFFRMDLGGRRVDLMRPLSEADRAARKSIGAAMFPMVPYANRIADNRFTFGGRTYRFAANNPPERFNVHGDGWQREWSGRTLGVGEALLELVSETEGAPYRYAASQRFRLSEDGLTVITGVENRGSVAMPFGFGQHPWFMRDAYVTVTFVAKELWIEGWDHTASERIATPPEFAFEGPTPLPKARRNNCYGAWDGKVEIVWPSRGVGLRITADPVFRHLMLFADPERPDFCLEPQTNAVCAFNLMEQGFAAADLGVIVLEPGEKAEGSIRFAPFQA
jgi:aldose 1-epimerase